MDSIIINTLVQDAVEHSNISVLCKLSKTYNYHCSTFCSYVVEYLNDKDMNDRRWESLCLVGACSCKFSKNNVDKYTELYEKYKSYTPTSKRRFCTKNTESITPEEYDLCLSRDSIKSFPHSYAMIQKIIDRVIFLKDNVALLWNESLLESRYAKYFKKIYMVSGESNIDADLLVKCLKLFPWFRTSVFPTNNLSYILRHHNPSINKTESKIDISNSAEFITSLEDINKRNLKRLIKDAQKEYTNVEVMNTENSIGDLIESFHPLDVARYCDTTGKIFQFTVCEFESLLEKKQNFITRSDLPPYFLLQIESMLKYHPDPKTSQPLREIVDELLKPKPTVEELLNIIRQKKIIERDDRVSRQTIRIRNISSIISDRRPIVRETNTSIGSWRSFQSTHIIGARDATTEEIDAFTNQSNNIGISICINPLDNYSCLVSVNFGIRTMVYHAFVKLWTPGSFPLDHDFDANLIRHNGIIDKVLRGENLTYGEVINYAMIRSNLEYIYNVRYPEDGVDYTQDRIPKLLEPEDIRNNIRRLVENVDIRLVRIAHRWEYTQFNRLQPGEVIDLRVNTTNIKSCIVTININNIDTMYYVPVKLWEQGHRYLGPFTGSNIVEDELELINIKVRSGSSLTNLEIVRYAILRSYLKYLSQPIPNIE